MNDNVSYLSDNRIRIPNGIPQVINGQIVMNRIDKNVTPNSQNPPNPDLSLKPAIERGASWSFNETRVLLLFWGSDMVKRGTNSKRTRHFWERIAEKLGNLGFVRSPDQARTRVFNLIAEYRRILKNESEERKKKFMFFEILQKIYQAKNANQVQEACSSSFNCDDDSNYVDLFDNVDEENILLGESNSAETSDQEQDRETFSYVMSPSNHQRIQFNSSSQQHRDQTSTTHHINSNDNQMNSLDQKILNQSIIIQRLKQQLESQKNRTDSLNGDHYSDNLSDNSRDQFTNHYTLLRNPINNVHLVNSHLINQKRNSNKNIIGPADFPNSKRRKPNDQNQSNLNDSTIFDTTVLLMDRMFEHLAAGTEAMREWIKLEERRLEQDIIRKQENRSKEERREQKYLQAIIKMQNQMFEFLAKQNDRTTAETMHVNLVDNLRDEMQDKFIPNEDEDICFTEKNEISPTLVNSDLIDENKNDNEEVTDQITECLIDDTSSADKNGQTMFATNKTPPFNKIDPTITPNKIINFNNTPIRQIDSTVEKQSTNRIQSLIRNLDGSISLIEKPRTSMQSTSDQKMVNESMENKHLTRIILVPNATQSKQNSSIDKDRFVQPVIDQEYGICKSTAKIETECNSYGLATSVPHEEIVNR